ncbi:MBL fold metallo-hydrolase [Clostridium sp. A1-XYC3]|uniref:MBL fold metallo-hydrolase n=1 Tax=Clostridium tanneri TaxID=3037988 RepID=A0ABU4JXL4_9CLOT|nr:MBL fold metallo-hydrolase [Clostridium sp. A1-XYC3]MDW8802916.1 MBL fold metallo-hydrolase [Clostridium sp. A1-XYC3]
MNVVVKESNIYEDLHQFSSYVPPIDLTFHQYLLLADEPILVHTGSMEQTEALIPQLKEILNGRTLKYIFVSHFESDECGGLSLILKHFPEAKPICSEVTARQLSGFGIAKDVLVKKPGEKLISSDYELEFINYPSEMHLWEGLLLIENKRGIFFSSDLVFGFGESHNTVIEGNWKVEIDSITPQQVSDSEARAKLQQTLMQLNPKFVATGHGPCLKF